MPERKPCFVIAPIGEPDSETRKRSDQVLKHIIRPAVESCGYDAIRADEIDKPGIITSQVIQRVVSDPLVVADLTERNPNVFYELAIRHAIRKPLVQIIKKGDGIPFDVAGTRTIQVDHHDLDSVEAAKLEIIGQVRALERDASELETPISVSLELQLLRQSDDPEERSLADLVAAVSDLRTSFTKLESRMPSPDSQPALEEIRSSLKELPARLEDRLEGGAISSRRRRRFHPMMIRDLARFASRKPSDPIGILIIASMLREDLPWLYEVCLEMYRKAKSRNFKAAREALDSFRHLAEMTLQGPWGRDILGGGKETYILLEELPMLLDDVAGFLGIKADDSQEAEDEENA